MKALGLDLIKSDSLKESIVDLYEISYNELAEVMRTSEVYSFGMMAPVLTDLFRTLATSGVGATHVEYNEVVKSDKYKITISYWIGLRYHAIALREKANLKGQKAIALINSVLQ